MNQPMNRPPVNQPQNQIPVTNQQLEQINANLMSEISYLRAINDKLISTNDKLNGIIFIMLLPLILAIGFILIGIICFFVLGINIFSNISNWLF